MNIAWLTGPEVLGGAPWSVAALPLYHLVNVLSLGWVVALLPLLRAAWSKDVACRRTLLAHDAAARDAVETPPPAPALEEEAEYVLTSGVLIAATVLVVFVCSVLQGWAHLLGADVHAVWRWYTVESHAP